MQGSATRGKSNRTGTAVGSVRTITKSHTVPSASRDCISSSLILGHSNTVTLPRLTGIPEVHRSYGGERLAAQLASHLLNLDLADATDWTNANRDPVEFVRLSLERCTTVHGGPEMQRYFDLSVTLSTKVLDCYAEEEEPSTEVFLIVEPCSAAYVILNPTLTLLDSIHERLPATFLDLFQTALYRWVRVYDYRDAEDRVSTLQDWATEDDDDNIVVPDVASAIPLSVRRKPLPNAALNRLPIQEPTVRQIVGTARRLKKVSEQAERPVLDDQVCEAMMDTNPPVPAMLMVFEPHDAIEGMFDEECQTMNELTPEPNVVFPFRADDPKSIQSAFAGFAVLCQTLALASTLVSLMPGNHTPEGDR